jgi:cob(I)alamin adenosyltransferase
MATKLTRIAVSSAALALLSVAAHAQQPPTAQDRLVALERQLEDLELRLQGRGSVAPGALANSDIAVTSRIDRLERSVDRLAADLQRVERALDNALREATAARRQAMQAERLARDAARPR